MVYGFLSALFWVVGTFWAMVVDMRTAVARGDDLMELLKTDTEINQERANKKFKNRKFWTAWFTLPRDFVDIVFQLQGNPALTDDERTKLKLYRSRVLAWVILCFAGIFGIFGVFE